MNVIEFKIEGFIELERALRQLPREIAGRVLVGALRRSGQPFAEDWSRSAPRSDAPEHGQHAADTIKVRAFREERDEDLVASLWIGPDRAHFYLSFDEFGKVGHPASFVGRNAWDRNRTRVLSSFSKELGGSIERAATRLGRHA